MASNSPSPEVPRGPEGGSAAARVLRKAAGALNNAIDRSPRASKLRDILVSVAGPRDLSPEDAYKRRLVIAGAGSLGLGLVAGAVGLGVQEGARYVSSKTADSARQDKPAEAAAEKPRDPAEKELRELISSFENWTKQQSVDWDKQEYEGDPFKTAETYTFAPKDRLSSTISVRKTDDGWFVTGDSPLVIGDKRFLKSFVIHNRKPDGSQIGTDDPLRIDMRLRTWDGSGEAYQFGYHTSMGPESLERAVPVGDGQTKINYADELKKITQKLEGSTKEEYSSMESREFNNRVVQDTLRQYINRDSNPDFWKKLDNLSDWPGGRNSFVYRDPDNKSKFNLVLRGEKEGDPINNISVEVYSGGWVFIRGDLPELDVSSPSMRLDSARMQELGDKAFVFPSAAPQSGRWQEGQVTDIFPPERKPRSPGLSEKGVVAKTVLGPGQTEITYQINNRGRFNIVVDPSNNPGYPGNRGNQSEVRGMPNEQVMTPEKINNWVEQDIVRYVNPDVHRKFPHGTAIDMNDPVVRRTLEDLRNSSSDYLEALKQFAQTYDVRGARLRGVAVADNSEYRLQFDADFPQLLGAFRSSQEGNARRISRVSSMESFIASSIDDNPFWFNYKNRRPNYAQEMSLANPDRGYSVKGLVESEIVRTVAGYRDGNFYYEPDVYSEHDERVFGTLDNFRQRIDTRFGEGTFDQFIEAFTQKEKNAIRLMNPGRTILDPKNSDTIIQPENVRGAQPTPEAIMDWFALRDGKKGIGYLTTDQRAQLQDKIFGE